MKVLYLTNIPSPYRVDFFQELGKLCELTVLYELEKAKDRNEKWQSRQEKKFYQEMYLKPLLRLTSTAWCPSVKEYLKCGKYDLIVVGGYSTPTGMYAISYLKRKKIPYLLNSDGGFVQKNEKAFKKKVKQYFISGATAYLSTGKECDQYFTFYGAEEDKLYHYPFSSLHEKDILENPFGKEKKKQLRTALGIEEEIVILSVGSFIPRKGFDILLEASGQLDRSYGFYIIGGEETEEYRRIRREHSLTNVHFLPFFESTELRRYYLAADLFVLPTREDIWGLVINEAMSAGLPVITTDKCVAGLELTDGCGKIVPAEDSDALADAIEEYVSNEKLCNEASNKALNKMREYTIENMARVHMEIFGDLYERR